jgi:hypothetical protein
MPESKTVPIGSPTQLGEIIGGMDRITLKIEEIFSSETLDDFQRDTRRYVPIVPAPDDR